MNARTIFLLFLLTGVGACSHLFENEGDRPVDFRLTGEVQFPQNNDSVYLAPPQVTAEAGTGQVTVAGDLLLPCGNAHPFATATREGNTLALEVDYKLERTCLNTAPKYTYEATLPQLEPGTYHLVVRQRLFLRDHGPPGLAVVLEEDVTVP